MHRIDRIIGALSRGRGCGVPCLPQRRVWVSLGAVVLVLSAGCTGPLLGGLGRPTVDNVRQDVPETHPDGPLNASEVRRLERMVLGLANHERGRRGIDDLQWSPELAHVNDYHAWDMWNRNYFHHDEPDGDGPENRVEQFGYQCPDNLDELQVSNEILEGESIRETASEIINSWLKSDSHRRGLLSNENELSAIGIYVDQSGTVYTVMILCDEVVKRPADVRGTNETVPQPLNETRYQPRVGAAETGQL